MNQVMFYTDVFKSLKFAIRFFIQTKNLTETKSYMTNICLPELQNWEKENKEL